MEMLDQSYGYILYRSFLQPGPAVKIHLPKLGDRAMLFLDGRKIGTLSRNFPGHRIKIPARTTQQQLDILVENQGRLNFGSGMLERKGITGGVLLDDGFHFGWENWALPLDNLSQVTFTTSGERRFPGFLKATFQLDQVGDTFLSLPGWQKGVAWINGFCLGRYWKRGPQKTLFLPAICLHEGQNEIILFEEQGYKKPQAFLRQKP
jgi:beta-galactosidase